MPRVGWDDMCEYTIPIPPSGRVKEFSEEVRPYLNSILNNIHESNELQQIRGLLLEEFMSGDTVLNDYKTNTSAIDQK